jgi:hypothetical protein
LLPAATRLCAKTLLSLPSTSYLSCWHPAAACCSARHVIPSPQHEPCLAAHSVRHVSTTAMCSMHQAHQQHRQHRSWCQLEVLHHNALHKHRSKSRSPHVRAASTQAQQQEQSQTSDAQSQQQNTTDASTSRNSSTSNSSIASLDVNGVGQFKRQVSVVAWALSDEALSDNGAMTVAVLMMQQPISYKTRQTHMKTQFCGRMSIPA